jgi:hypothetical protein
MKATLSFNLPEESIEHLDALHGHEWKGVVMRLYNSLRNCRKHGHSYESADDAIDDLFDSVLCDIQERGITLD